MSKKSFKIVLNSYDTTSYAGIQTNASYFVDLKNVLRDPEDFKKAWNMTYCLKSVSAASSSNQITPTKVFSLSINLGNAVNVLQYKNSQPYVGLLNVNNDFTAYTSTACPTFFDTKESDNKPIFIDDLKNVNFINLTINDVTNAVIHDAANAYTASNRYVCILTFEEAH
jgi:hypothetical protein